MAFTVKDWKDSPDTSTPLSAAAIEDLETRLAAYTDSARTQVFSLGLVGTPSITFTGDLNTGIYSPSADQISLVTAGAARLTIDASGNVTQGAGQSLRPLGAVGTPSLSFTGDLNTGIYSPGADQLSLVTAGADRLVIGSGGAVTIAGTLAVAGRNVGQDGLSSIVAATSAIANTETVVVSATIPANQMQAGTTYQIRASGVSTASTATAGATFRVRVGTTTLTGNIPASLTGTSASGGPIPFSLDCLVTVRTAGASGTIIGSIAYNSNAATGTLNATIAVNQVTATVVVDTTVQNLLELTYISGVGTTSATFHNASIRPVKA